MDYFILKPNYNILSKYFVFDYSPDEMRTNFSKGHLIEADFFYEETIEAINRELRISIEYFVGKEHVDNLMFILLNAHKSIEASLLAAEEQNNFNQSLKDLAELILFFNEKKKWR
ncbi:hypothetical protein [Desertivirga xinjiangensis]|uniref:hypothetical protein n=1 Tax=Desertivirga xinjiangensis TaxID=539206 RepID=UPI0021097F40|nr:hypothetical protein [Pedobacter xinjiangensis]